MELRSFQLWRIHDDQPWWNISKTGKLTWLRWNIYHLLIGFPPRKKCDFQHPRSFTKGSCIMIRHRHDHPTTGLVADQLLRKWSLATVVPTELCRWCHRWGYLNQKSMISDPSTPGRNPKHQQKSQGDRRIGNSEHRREHHHNSNKVIKNDQRYMQQIRKHQQMQLHCVSEENI